MLLAPLQWIARNLSTLILAFILAIVVWVSAVVTADPNEERTYLRPVTLVGQDDGLEVIGTLPTQARITLRAPRSILNRLTNNPNQIQAWIDLTGLGPGTHAVPVRVSWNLSPVRLSQIEPEEVTFELEQVVTQSFDIQLNVDGEPALGYRKGSPTIEPAQVIVSGRQSQVTKVAGVRASLSISGAGETVRTNVPVEAVDANGNLVNEITVTPKTVLVTQPINILGGYKNVVVKVVSTGNIANGYRLTNISVSPLTVTVYSENPQLVEEIPGYVETMPVNLTGLNDDIEVRMNLNLPPGVSLVGEQSVLVQVSVAAMEGSIKITLPVEVVGLPPELIAQLSPEFIDVIITGPLPVLDTLTPASFRAVVNLAGLAPGMYQISPEIDLAPDDVQIQARLPESLEVIILPTPTSTPAAEDGAPPLTGTPLPPAVTAQP